MPHSLMEHGAGVRLNIRMLPRPDVVRTTATTDELVADARWRYDASTRYAISMSIALGLETEEGARTDQEVRRERSEHEVEQRVGGEA